MLTRHVAGRVYNYDYCIGRRAPGGTGFSCSVDFALGSQGSLYVVSRGTEFGPSQGITKCTLEQELVRDDRGLAFGGGQSPWPRSVDVDSDENVYIADDHMNRISIYDRDGVPLSRWGVAGSGDGELSGPSGLAFERNGNLYVVDSLNHRVQVFTRDGRFLFKWGERGSGPGQFDMPCGITIDKQGDVYVADWRNDRIQKYTPEGNYLATFGALETGEGQLRRPSDVAVDGDGDVYVADWRNDRIQKYTPEGNYLATFGALETGEGQLRRPSDVAVDGDGDVYVADWGNERLNIYTGDGEYITSFSGDADTLSAWAQAHVDANPDYRRARKRADLTQERRFQRPVAVNVDDQGRIMVLETVHGRMQVYVKERDFVD